MDTDDPYHVACLQHDTTYFKKPCSHISRSGLFLEIVSQPYFIFKCGLLYITVDTCRRVVRLLASKSIATMELDEI